MESGRKPLPLSAGHATAPASLPERLRVFVLTGQSNSLGTAADPKEEDPAPGPSPLDARVPFFWANRSTRSGDNPGVLIGDSGGRILTLGPQQGEGSNPMFWGPEIGFGRRLTEAGVSNFLIVKASRGGGGNGFWFKNGADNHMYRHVKETVEAAVSALPAGAVFTLEALLYLQGESDSDREAPIAGERLRALAANLRKDLPHAEAMKILVAGIAAPGPRRDIVRAQQSALPAADPTFRYVDTLDLAPHLYDQLHFDKTAKLEIGRRLADAWLNWNGLPHPSQSIFNHS